MPEAKDKLNDMGVKVDWKDDKYFRENRESSFFDKINFNFVGKLKSVVSRIIRIIRIKIG